MCCCSATPSPPGTTHETLPKPCNRKPQFLDRLPFSIYETGGNRRLVLTGLLQKMAIEPASKNAIMRRAFGFRWLSAWDEELFGSLSTSADDEPRGLCTHVWRGLQPCSTDCSSEKKKIKSNQITDTLTRWLERNVMSWLISTLFHRWLVPAVPGPVLLHATSSAQPRV